MISQKEAEVADLHRLVEFHQKYQDAQGEADARTSIAATEADIAEMRATVTAIIQGPLSSEPPVNKAVANVTQSKRRHMRQRSLSTTALPNSSKTSSGRTSEVVTIPSGTQSPAPEPEPAAEAAVAPCAEPPRAWPSAGCSCVALYDFHGANVGELSFRVGDCIVLKSTQGGDWFLGYVASDPATVGWFPAVGYVRPQ